jgi:hypothetical protein
MGMAATGALKTAGGRRTAGEAVKGGVAATAAEEEEEEVEGVWTVEEGGEAMTLVPEGMEPAGMGRAKEGTGGARTVS